MKRKTIAAKVFAALIATGSTAPAYAGQPVIDITSIITSVENAAQQAYAMASQYTQQLLQYTNQLQQYETQLTNLAELPAQSWNSVIGPANQFLAATSALTNMVEGSGGMDAYLGQFQTIQGYQNNSCFGITGCTAAAKIALDSVQNLGSNAQKAANDAAMQTARVQHNASVDSAALLDKLQAAAAGAQGALQASTAGNQLAGFQAGQLVQLNNQIASNQAMEATRNEVLRDREAQAAAYAAAQRVTTNVQPTPNIPIVMGCIGPC